MKEDITEISTIFGMIDANGLDIKIDSKKWERERIVGNNACITVIDILKINRYLLDGYVCGEKKVIQVNEKEYEIQKYQGEHQNEYLISEMKDGKVEGRCELFENGILRLSWIMKDGQRIGRISEYEKGKALFKEEWKSILEENEERRIIENSKEGLKLVLFDENDLIIYRGEFDEELNRHGKGIEYENGKMKYEGYWNKGELMRIVREFKGDEMIEYVAYNNIDVLNRIPLYVGEYNIVNGEFKRNGIGYLLDKNGTAMRECIYKNGEELNGIGLFNGWYVKAVNDNIRCVLDGQLPDEIADNIVVDDKRIEIHKTVELNEMGCNMRDLIVGSNCCNDLTILNLQGYKRLQSIIIGDNCFYSVDTFTIDGLNDMKSLKIGKRSFTKKKDWYGNKTYRSFHILNCDVLESISIGENSFSDYGGEFELKNLPKLSSLIIGNVHDTSYCFYFCSLVVKGFSSNIDLYIRFTKSHFTYTWSRSVSSV